MFTFLLAITGVNVFCVSRFFVVVLRLVRDLQTYHKLCRKFAWMLIDTEYYLLSEKRTDDVSLVQTRCHDIRKPSIYASSYRNCAWVCEANVKPAQSSYRWLGCQKMTCNYWLCTLATWRCPFHHAQHVVDATKDNLASTGCQVIVTS